LRLRGQLAHCLRCCLAVLALAACSRGADPDKELRIGLLVPQSAVPSMAVSRGAAEALVARVNAEGGLDLGGRKLMVRLLVEDTGGQVERVMAAATRLISQERVSALVGPYYSRTAIPVAGVAEQSHVPMVSPSASNPLLTKGRNSVFRVCMVDTVQGRIMARFAQEDLGLRRAAVLFDEADAYSDGLAGLFSESFGLLGGQVTARETYVTGATDFTAQLARIRASGAQALFLPNFPADLVLQVAQARAAGFSGVFLGGDSWDSDKSIHALPQAEGAFFSTDFAWSSLAGQLLHEAERYRQELGAPLDKNAALTLDALGVILAGAKAAGSADPVSLREGIASLRGYEGFSGRLSFERGGDAVRGAHIMAIEGGQARCRKELGATP
jgi:branched-chain amino acid transport system substrate-binding protein